jgi:hypothetical protein
VRDTNGNIFGGFTPVKWESYKGANPGIAKLKPDPSLRSFLFTLKNPHGLPPTTFKLLEASYDAAIGCNAFRGPIFQNLRIADNCATSGDNAAFFDGENDC